MIVHVLNGDALARQLSKSYKNKIVFRECLIEGPCQGSKHSDFWSHRADFFLSNYQVSKEEYDTKSLNEIRRMDEFQSIDEICLWFEFDLFCQTNFWFLVQQLNTNYPNSKISWVHPDHEEWTGFGSMDLSDLNQSYIHRKELDQKSVQAIKQIWNIYSQDNWLKQELMLNYEHLIIQLIQPSIEALLQLDPTDKDAYATSIISNLIDKFPDADFKGIFQMFSSEYGVYGYGDLQLYRMYSIVINPT